MRETEHSDYSGVRTKMPARPDSNGIRSAFLRNQSAFLHEAFLRHLKAHGCVEGRISHRLFDLATAEPNLPTLAAESSTKEISSSLQVPRPTAAPRPRHSIPVVMGALGDPVAGARCEQRPAATNSPGVANRSWSPRQAALNAEVMVPD